MGASFSAGHTLADQTAYTAVSTSDAQAPTLPLSDAASPSPSCGQPLGAPLRSSLWFWLPLLLLLLLLLAPAGAVISGSNIAPQQAHVPVQPTETPGAHASLAGATDPDPPAPPPPAPARAATPSPCRPSTGPSAGLAKASAAEAPLRVALCFFGQVKNLSQVVTSLRRNVLGPLHAANHSVHIFAHTYSFDAISNPRASEAAPIFPDSITMLRKDADSLTVRFTQTDAVDRKRPLDFYLTNGNPWPGTHNNTLLFYVRQLHSLEYCTGLWAGEDDDEGEASQGAASRPAPASAPAAPAPFDFVIYLRPDVRFFSRLPALNRSLCDDEVVVPDFHHWGGVNDRFAIGRPRAMALYGRRVRYIETYFRRHKHSLHAEGFLKRFLEDHHLRVREARMRFGRVRASGAVHGPDACNDADCDMNA